MILSDYFKIKKNKGLDNFREIIYLFSEDLRTTQISDLTKIFRPSINRYLTAIRLRLRMKLMKNILTQN